MTSFLTNLFPCKMLLNSNCYKFFSFLQISFTSVLEKHLILWLVVSFGKSRSFVFPKFLLDIPQLPKLKLHYWENIKTTVFRPSPTGELPDGKFPEGHIFNCTIIGLLKNQMFNFLKIVLEWLFLFCFKWNVRFL